MEKGAAVSHQRVQDYAHCSNANSRRWSMERFDVVLLGVYVHHVIPAVRYLNCESAEGVAISNHDALPDNGY
jgi:hypothetical protein